MTKNDINSWQSFGDLFGFWFGEGFFSLVFLWGFVYLFVWWGFFVCLFGFGGVFFGFLFWVFLVG